MSCKNPKHVFSVSLSYLGRITGYFASRHLMAGVVLTLGYALCSCSRQSDESHAESAAATGSELVAVARAEEVLNERGPAIVPDETKPLTVLPANGIRARVVPERVGTLSSSAVRAKDMKTRHVAQTSPLPVGEVQHETMEKLRVRPEHRQDN